MSPRKKHAGRPGSRVHGIVRDLIEIPTDKQVTSLEFTDCFHHFPEECHLTLIRDIEGYQGVRYFVDVTVQKYVPTILVSDTLVQLESDRVSDGDHHSTLFLGEVGLKHMRELFMGALGSGV